MKKLIYIFWAVAILSLGACGSGEVGGGGGGKSVYIAGVVLDGNNNYFGGYWKDGTWVLLQNAYSTGSLTNGTQSSVSSMAASGSTLYIGGSCFNSTTSKWMSGYWMLNGSKTPVWVELPKLASNKDAGVQSITIDGGTVYAGGYCVDSSDVSVAGYWVSDGSTTPEWVELPDGYGSTNASVTTITLNGGNVYAGGYCVNSYGANAAGYWVSDGTATPTWVELTNPGGKYNNCYVNSIILNGGNVYAGGSSYNASGLCTAGYWVSDGTTAPTWVVLANPYDSSYSGWVNSMVIKGGVIYAGGACINLSDVSVAGYWVSDGTATPEFKAFANTLGSSNNSSVYCMAIDGDDIYFAGDMYNSSGVEYASYRKRDAAAWTKLSTGYDTEVYSWAWPNQIIIK